MSLPIDPAMVSTLGTLSGYRIVRSLGVAEGVWINPRIFFPEQNVRRDTMSAAFVDMLVQAAKQGANAVVGLAFADPPSDFRTIVVAHGTAVVVEAER
jgi:uncharacterized protein YbjQ (UPF0145 family)